MTRCSPLRGTVLGIDGTGACRYKPLAECRNYPKVKPGSGAGGDQEEIASIRRTPGCSVFASQKSNLSGEQTRDWDGFAVNHSFRQNPPGHLLHTGARKARARME